MKKEELILIPIARVKQFWLFCSRPVGGEKSEISTTTINRSLGKKEYILMMLPEYLLDFKGRTALRRQSDWADSGVTVKKAGWKSCPIAYAGYCSKALKY